MHSTGFDFQPRTRVIFGQDTLERVGELARDFRVRRVLLVTDKGIAAVGHAGRAIGFLEAAGLRVAVFDGVRENPTTVDVLPNGIGSTALTVTVGQGDYSRSVTASSAGFVRLVQ